VCSDVVIPVGAVGMVIGKMGAAIKLIKDESGAEVRRR
jgi:hypothetical protein